MGCRGLWNLHFNGRWYRCCHPRGCISEPDHPVTLKKIKQLCEHPGVLDTWEEVPFPAPLHSNLDWVYTIHLDAGTWAITFWDEAEGGLLPKTVCLDLLSACQASSLSRTDLRQLPSHFPTWTPEIATDDGSVQLAAEPLRLTLGFPTPLNELQARLFIDFLFPWRYYIDDPMTWYYGSPVFKRFCFAILRLAAWDFELSYDADVELPISYNSVPSWNCPKDNVYWFHGFLVVLHDDLRSQAMIISAVWKAQQYVGHPTVSGRGVRLIMMSPYHIAFAELSNGFVTSTRSIVLLSNSSAMQCSPGFRALGRILTSDCWKHWTTNRETWKYPMPAEIIQHVLQKLEPRDAVALSQASFTAEECYYARIPQFPGMTVRSFPLLIPCCGRRSGLEECGIMCSACYSWQHGTCVELPDGSDSDTYVCVPCRSDGSLNRHTFGGLQRFSRHIRRQGCQVRLDDTAKLLQSRLLKPAHLRPELRFRRDLSRVPPEGINYTIRFNGCFSGLAYGLDDEY